MDDIEHLVRVTLTDRAAVLEAPSDLGRRARGRASAARRRARAAAGVAVAAAAVLLAVPAATRMWAPPQSSTVDAAAAPSTRLEVPAFPLTPGVSLPGYGEPVAQLSAGVPWLSYDGGADRWLRVSVTEAEPHVAAKSLAVVVRERKASLEAGSERLVLTWRAADGRWVRVEADRHLGKDALIGYAAGLTPGAVPVLWPFTFDVVPPGTVTDVVGPAAVCFRPEAAEPSGAFVGKLTVMLSYTAEVSPSGRPVMVGGRGGWLAEGGTDVLSVALGDGRTLVVQSEIGLGEAELVAFAAGVNPTADAEVGRG